MENPLLKLPILSLLNFNFALMILTLKIPMSKFQEILLQFLPEWPFFRAEFLMVAWEHGVGQEWGGSMSGTS